MSAEVGAPHEVTPTELVMLARMGATVMGKVWTRAASKRGRSKKLEQSAGKGSVAEVLTGVHAGMDLQVLAFGDQDGPRLGILKVNSHLFSQGGLGRK